MTRRQPPPLLASIIAGCVGLEEHLLNFNLANSKQAMETTGSLPYKSFRLSFSDTKLVAREYLKGYHEQFGHWKQRNESLTSLSRLKTSRSHTLGFNAGSEFPGGSLFDV
jgi:hypothetical protein